MSAPATAEDRLARLGPELPAPPAAVAAFGPFVRVGNTVYVSGQIATRDGLVATGRHGDDLDVAAGQAAARLCGLNVLARLRSAAGSLDVAGAHARAAVGVSALPAGSAVEVEAVAVLRTDGPS